MARNSSKILAVRALVKINKTTQGLDFVVRNLQSLTSVKETEVSLFVSFDSHLLCNGPTIVQHVLWTSGQNRTTEILIYTNPKVLVLIARRSLLFRIALEE